MKHSVVLLLLGALTALLGLASSAADVANDGTTQQALCAVSGHFHLSLMAHMLSCLWVGSPGMAGVFQDMLHHQCISKQDGSFDSAKAAKLVDDVMSGDKNGIWLNMMDKFIKCPTMGRELGDVMRTNLQANDDKTLLMKLNTPRHIAGFAMPMKGVLGILLEMICGSAPPPVYGPPHQGGHMGPSGSPRFQSASDFH